jgi:RNA polymerase sigma-70 factor, ECF subfamily
MIKVVADGTKRTGTKLSYEPKEQLSCEIEMSCETSTSSLAEFLRAHSQILAELGLRAAADRWDLAPEEFAAALFRSAVYRFGGTLPPGEALETYLRTLHLEDMALVCALQKGSGPAWEEFVERYRPILRGAARAMVGAAGEARARELADSLFAELYGLEGAGGTRGRALLDYFHGRSKLATWLRTVLAQRHVDALRAGKRTESLDDDESPVDQGSIRQPASSKADASERDDPDRTRLLPQLRQAMAAALAALEPGQRLLLSLYYVQELTLAQVARLRGVHEATISRQMDGIRQEIRETIRRTLASASPGPSGRAGLSPAEIELCFSYALDDWAFDLGSALSSGPREGT